MFMEQLASFQKEQVSKTTGIQNYCKLQKQCFRKLMF